MKKKNIPGFVQVAENTYRPIDKVFLHFLKSLTTAGNIDDLGMEYFTELEARIWRQKMLNLLTFGKEEE